MIKFKINGSDTDVKSCWEDLTFSDYLRVINPANDHTDYLSIITGIERETLLSAKIIGLESLIQAAQFLQKPSNYEIYYPTLGPYKLEGKGKNKQFDIRYESLAQFEDARTTLAKVDIKDIVQFTKSYGRIVAIYTQKLRDGEYKNSRVDEAEAELQNFPACQVIALGQFFFLNIARLLNGTQPTSPLTNQKSKKSKSGSMSSKRNLGRTR